MSLVNSLRSLWQRVMIRNTAFSSRYMKLRMLYSMEDPWNMTSLKEQTRFQKTNELLASIAPSFRTILELGCGEGHQTSHIKKLTDQIYGVDLSAQAIKRARLRCPSESFVVSGVEDVQDKFPDMKFDLIVACEVLYYANNIGTILDTCKNMSSRIFVSNYLPRSVSMRQYFSGEGWRQLDTIEYEETIWECFVWESPDLSP